MPDGPSPGVWLLDQLASLERFYGALPTPPRDAFRFYVWETLSVQTTPARRDAAYAALQRLPALTPDSMWRAPRGKLEAAVSLAGVYHEQRLSALRAGVDLFRRQPRLGLEVRRGLWRARRALARLPRIGEGSVHRVLLFSGDHCVLPVDLDVARLARRLGMAPAQTGGVLRRVRHALERGLPRDPQTFRHAAMLLRHHAVQTCGDDPHCTVCPLAAGCPSRKPAPI